MTHFWQKNAKIDEIVRFFVALYAFPPILYFIFLRNYNGAEKGNFKTKRL